MRKTFSLAMTSVAILALASIAPAASAAETTSDEVPVSIRPGALTVSLSEVPSFTGTISSSSRTITGQQSITVSDLRGSGAGYRVTQNVSEVSGSSIQPSDFAVTASTAQSSLDLDAPGNEFWPQVSLGTGGNLGGAGQTVLTAGVGEGMGSYKTDFAIGLTLPTAVLAGEYTALLTTSVVSGNL